MVEIPRRQSSFWLEGFNRTVESGYQYYMERWDKTGIDPCSIKTAVQLGPGVGVDLGLYLKLFPNVQMHAIDYHDSLHPSLRNHPRVTFHQGLFTEVLEQTQFPPFDLTIMRFIGEDHGFTANTIGLLRTLVGDDGLLLTDGENGNIEYKGWFKERFLAMNTLDANDPIILWKGKK